MKVSAWCARCDQRFDRDYGKTWQKLCWSCWRETKGSNSGAYKAPSKPDHRHTDFKKYLPLLIRLCHPDRHENSKTANEVTQWLLDERKEGKND